MAQLLVVSSTSVATPSLAYCNADFSTGRVPALPEGATLRQVHVLIRHGARAPSDNRPAWANDTAEFECNATSLFGHVGAPDRTVLRHGAVLFRKRYVRNRLPGTCTTGQLVQPGWQMEHASGTHLKERYSSLLPTTLDGDGQSTFYLRSDDSERTLQSGAALFSGMYPDAAAPDGGSATIVPMHIILAAALLLPRRALPTERLDLTTTDQFVSTLVVMVDILTRASFEFLTLCSKKGTTNKPRRVP